MKGPSVLEWELVLNRQTSAEVEAAVVVVTVVNSDELFASGIGECEAAAAAFANLIAVLLSIHT